MQCYHAWAHDGVRRFKHGNTCLLLAQPFVRARCVAFRFREWIFPQEVLKQSPLPAWIKLTPSSHPDGVFINAKLTREVSPSPLL
jgi:hypothetical protein